MTSFEDKLIKNITETPGFYLVKAKPSQLTNCYLSLISAISKVSSGVIINFRNPSFNDKKKIASKGIDTSNLAFIDAVCVRADEMPDDDSIFYLMNPNDLDGIIESLDSIFLKYSPSFVAIDIIDIALYYNSIEKIVKSLLYLKTESQKKKFSVIVFTGSENLLLVSEISKIADEMKTWSE
ncbi:MAG: hypothetical protein V1859_01860 [archaeon]